MLKLLILLCFLHTISFASHSNYIKKNAVQFSNENFPKILFEKLSKKIVLFGENHGVKEFPQIFYSIIQSFSETQNIIIGLEFPNDVQNHIDVYLKDGDLTKLNNIPFFNDSNYHSGRASASMIAMLKKLRSLKNITIFCFDVNKSNSSSKNRDTLMAKRVINKAKITGSTPLFLLTGNIHSRLTPGTPWDAKYPTMGSEILRLSNSINLTNITNVLFRQSEGSSWQCRLINNSIKCGEYFFGPSQSRYATEVEYDHYFLSEQMVESGHYNTLFVRKVSSSFPYF